MLAYTTALELMQRLIIYAGITEGGVTHEIERSRERSEIRTSARIATRVREMAF
jgi:hypothetical protein